MAKSSQLKRRNICVLQCPLCLKKESYVNHDLICSKCHNKDIELIRNSCIDNSMLNDAAKDKINKIFNSCLSNDFSKLNSIAEGHSGIPLVSIKTLALQLKKLDILNEKIKLKNIDRSTELLNQKIENLKKEIELSQEETVQVHETIDTTLRSIVNSYAQRKSKLGDTYAIIKREKVLLVARHSLLLQYEHFKTLKDITFSDSTASQGYGAYPKSFFSNREILFHNQPIINIGDFFAFNNKLSQLNEFLEGLIMFQMQLQELFRDMIRLPYLTLLMHCLPDSKFYELIQQKENIIYNTGNPDETKSEENASEDFRAGEAEDDIRNEVIIKLGNAMKLPLSFKTINAQLRQATLSRNEKLSNHVGDESNEKLISNVTSGFNHKRNLTGGKKLVIMPHKILNKPLTKLSTKEFLKFLLIIVKLIVNFNVILFNTVESPSSQEKGSKLSINKFIQPKNRGEGHYEYTINFSSILKKISSIDTFLKLKIDHLNSISGRVAKDSSSQDLPSSEIPPTTSQSVSNSQNRRNSRDRSLNISSSVAHPSLNSPSDHQDFNKRQKSIGLFYHSFLNSIQEETNEKELNGLINDEFFVKEENALFENRFRSHSSHNFDLKLIMQKVYKLMTSNSSRYLKSNSILSSSKVFDPGTVSMMTESKAQLDEWDLVSKMY